MKISQLKLFDKMERIETTNIKKLLNLTENLLSNKDLFTTTSDNFQTNFYELLDKNLIINDDELLGSDVETNRHVIKTFIDDIKRILNLNDEIYDKLSDSVKIDETTTKYSFKYKSFIFIEILKKHFYQIDTICEYFEDVVDEVKDVVVDEVKDVVVDEVKDVVVDEVKDVVVDEVKDVVVDEVKDVVVDEDLRVVNENKVEDIFNIDKSKIADYLKTIEIKNFNSNDLDNIVKLIYIECDDDDEEVSQNRIKSMCENFKSIDISMCDKNIMGDYFNMSDIKTNRDIKQKMCGVFIGTIISLLIKNDKEKVEEVEDTNVEEVGIYKYISPNNYLMFKNVAAVIVSPFALTGLLFCRAVYDLGYIYMLIRFAKYTGSFDHIKNLLM